ncbi:unnamed protein product [Brassica oleracea]|uniref:(rape) hypothetical protein n=1 Tax=Brassica napus TaxID=3708 RepID=A0A816Q613_BRANA|nr:unnamed protein product [Brassica napus]
MFGGASARVLASEGFPSLPCLSFLICFIVVLFTLSVLSVALFLESCRRRLRTEFLKLLGGTKAHRGGRLAHCSRLSCGPWSLSTLEVPFNSKSRLASTPACVGVVVFGAGSIVVVHWRSVVYGLFVALLGCSSQSLSLFSAACDQYSSGAMST